MSYDAARVTGVSLLFRSLTSLVTQRITTDHDHAVCEGDAVVPQHVTHSNVFSQRVLGSDEMCLLFKELSFQPKVN